MAAKTHLKPQSTQHLLQATVTYPISLCRTVKRRENGSLNQDIDKTILKIKLIVHFSFVHWIQELVQVGKHGRSLYCQMNVSNTSRGEI